MKKITDKEKMEIVEKYKSNKYNFSDIGKLHKISSTTVSKIIKSEQIENNIMYRKKKRKYTLNENYFDVIDTEHKAYFLGLLYADGCNYEKKNVIYLKLQEKDKEILEKFNLAIESNRPLGFIKKKKESHQNSFVLSISSNLMSKKLAELGCFQKKSLTLKFPTEEQVPNHLIRHFIRGYFDGDGSFTKYKDSKRDYYRMTVSIIGTIYFTTILKEIIKHKLNINCNLRIRKGKEDKTTRNLIFGGKNICEKFLNWIYNDCTFYLNRKYQKFQNCINNQPQL